MLVPAKYKTTLCQQFFSKGYCNYGPRCQFLHKEPNPTTSPKISIDYKKIVEGMGLAVDYEGFNREDVANIENFMNKIMNLSKFNLKPLNVFQKCLINTQ